jgi:oligopeptide transport system permease protein
MPTPTISPTTWRRALKRPGVALGAGFLGFMLAICLGSLPWTFGMAPGGVQPRYNAGEVAAARLPPWWAWKSRRQVERLNSAVPTDQVDRIASAAGLSGEQAREATAGPAAAAIRHAWPRAWLGTDGLGRSVLVRVLAGGAISLTVGVAAALISVALGTAYGALAGYAGGWIDGVMMRVVDVLYGLPYVLLVVLLAIAGDAVVNEYVSRQRERASWVTRQVQARPGIERQVLADEALARMPPRALGEGTRRLLDLATLLVAIAGVSWLTTARVVRGQVLSLKSRQHVEAAVAMGASTPRVLCLHILPGLAGVVTAYATLAVPQAILQESFLSFLGIGVRAPWPSWGTLAAEGLGELNPYDSSWWLLAAPCTLLAFTLLALNFVGEGLRAALEGPR